MSQIILTTIGSELHKVERNLYKEMELKTGHVSDYLDLRLSTLDRYFYPAAVILTAKMLGQRSARILSLAGAVQLINLAYRVHSFSRGALAFPILIGDYFYSKFLSFLCDAEATAFLDDFAQIIAAMNEAAVIREKWKNCTPNAGERWQVIKKETALLTAAAVGNTVQICRGPQADTRFAQFGLQLGLAWGGLKESLPDTQDCIKAAKEQLAALAVDYKVEPLSGLVDLMGYPPEEIEQFVAV